MGTVDIGIRHDNDFVITRLVGVEGTIIFMVADSCSYRSDQTAYLRIVQHLVQARLFNIQQLPAKRENGLRETIAALFCRTTCGVSLHDVQFTFRGILLRTIGELARQAASGKGSFPNGFTRLASSLASSGGMHDLINDDASFIWVGLEMIFHFLTNNLLHDSIHLAIGQLRLGLTFEARLGNLNRNDSS